jgi:hypothetical protein
MTPWTLDGAWDGETVAVLGNAPSLAQHLKRLPAGCKVIAASRAIQHYPAADMLVVIDGNIPEGFAGIVANGVPGAGLFLGLVYERVTLNASHTIEFRNTGLLAIRTAARLGAKRIVLAGFDTDRYEQFHRDGFACGSSACIADGVTQAFVALLADLRARGIVVEVIEDEAAPEWQNKSVLLGDQTLPVVELPPDPLTFGALFRRK